MQSRTEKKLAREIIKQIKQDAASVARCMLPTGQNAPYVAE